MSRIGKKIIPLADKVKITLVDGHVTVEGPKGKLSMVINPNTSVDVENETIVVSRKHDNKVAQAAHGMMRAVLHGYRDWETDRKSTRLNSSHSAKSRMPSSA